MHYKAPDDKLRRLRELDEEKRAIYREIDELRKQFFAWLESNGSQRYVLEVRYSEAYDPWGSGSGRRDGETSEYVYYFAPHVQIPEFGEFVRTYGNDGDEDFVEFLDTLQDEDWYEA